MFDFFQSWVLSFVDSLNYFWVFVLMTIQSSFIPFPSEVVIPPAAYKAASGELNFWLIIVFGLLGSALGAIVNYFLAYFLGRPVVYKLAEGRIGKMLLIKKSSLDKGEKYFLKYGELATFVCRLIPGVRQIISLVAGFARMKFLPFIFYTMLGSGLWIFVLALIGFYVGQNGSLADVYIVKWGLAAVLGVILLVIGLLFAQRRKKKRQ